MVTCTIDLEHSATTLADAVTLALAEGTVIIRRGGKELARIERTSRDRESHPTEKLPARVFGSAKGQIWMADDFDEPLEDFKEYTG